MDAYFADTGSPLLDQFLFVSEFLSLWFVLGPGGLREAPRRPTEGPREPPGAPGAPRARVNKIENLYFLAGLFEAAQGGAHQVALPT